MRSVMCRWGTLRFAQKQFTEAAKAYQDALDRNAESMDGLRGLVNVYVAAEPSG